MSAMKSILEGLLFLSGDEGLSIEQICETCEIDPIDANFHIEDLMKEYIEDRHGIEIVHYGGVYKFISKEKIHPYAEKLFASTKMSNLSQAALETLAIIAYKQPITRVEIEEIRGVSCDMMIRKLLARSLIKECGRTDAPGRPYLYEVTSEFMDAFKLESLKELPDLPVIEQNMDSELFNE